MNTLDLFSAAAAPSVGDRVDLLALNVQSPPRKRAVELARWLFDQNAEWLLLSEVSNAEGSQQLLEDLRRGGYSVLGEMPPSRDYAAFILRRGAALSAKQRLSTSLGARVCACRLQDVDADLVLVNAYVPALGIQNLDRRPRFLDDLCEYLRSLQNEGCSILLAGDLNVLERGHTPRVPMFDQERPHAFDRFIALGLIDVFRHLHPERVEHSWLDRNGAGQRLDHVMMSRNLLSKAVSFSYVADTRTRRLSDHSALLASFSRRVTPLVSQRPGGA